MEIISLSPQELLVYLNDAEKKNAPGQLYVMGDRNLALNYMSVSIVGSRDATPDGVRRASIIAKEVVDRGGVVVSGLAKGIDTAAHKAAINAGGRTIAVIGTPLDKYYPAENKELQDLIANEHLLVSQFKVGTPSLPKNFVLRNRTMALLSDATIIVEAGEKSGTIHQGWEALRLGRQLFIMESVVNNPKLSWPAEFIRYGAEVLTRESLDDCFSLLPTSGRGEAVSLAF